MEFSNRRIQRTFYSSLLTNGLDTRSKVEALRHTWIKIADCAEVCDNFWVESARLSGNPSVRPSLELQHNVSIVTIDLELVKPPPIGSVIEFIVDRVGRSHFEGTLGPFRVLGDTPDQLESPLEKGSTVTGTCEYVNTRDSYLWVVP